MISKVIAQLIFNPMDAPKVITITIIEGLR
jgi:hypothetical protein